VSSGRGFDFPRLRRRAGWLALLSMSAACAHGSGGVTRMAKGVRYDGRYISPEAYTAYAIGVQYESRGELAKAVARYLEARAEDPESPELWARIGAARCFATEAPRGPSIAARAFENGIQLDPNYYGNYFERARCEERARVFDSALTDALAAVARRPGDEPANLLVARLKQAQGRPADARAWLEAFASFHDTSPAMHRAVEAARKPGLAAPSADETHSFRPLSARSVAFAELYTGQLEAARKHAQVELDADPTNSDAWIAALVACDALRDEVCFESTLGSLKSPSLAPSDTALTFLRELLARRAGADAPATR
jgi:tetratricopeptide (TPR) repeat protein